MKRLIIILMVLMMSSPTITHAAKRVALVIGNADYANSPLANPVNDASDMAATLKKLGFQVALHKNADRSTMKKAIRAFARNSREAQVRLFYFAGHGMQVRNVNYLIPINADVANEFEVEDEGLNAARVMGAMEAAGKGVNVVILDACRNNPFKRSFRSSARGLARMRTPHGTIIAYATEPGGTAADGQGRNGVFTKYLMQHMNTSGLDIEDIFRHVRKSVYNATDGKQVPWSESSIMDAVYLAGDKKPTTVAAVAPTTKGRPTTPTTFGTLSVDSSPVPAMVYLDNKLIGETPLMKKITKISHKKLTLLASGYAKHERIVSIGPGKNVDIKAQLVRSNYGKNSAVLGLALSLLGATNPNLSKNTPPKQVVSAAKPRIEPNSKHKQGESWVDPITNMTFVWLPGGCYNMGSNTGDYYEKPVHKVCINGFWMGKYEVTRGQFRSFAKSSNYKTTAETEGKAWIFTRHGLKTKRWRNWQKPGFKQDDSHPAVAISWNDANAFARWLSSKNNRSFRLPTEAEWEWAARAGTSTSRYWGDSDNAACNYGNVYDKAAKREYRLTTGNFNCKDNYIHTAPVGAYRPNQFGLHDMLGNVMEWGADYWDFNSYGTHTMDNPKHTSPSKHRVIRGGTWLIVPKYVRSAARGGLAPNIARIDMGFRLVMTE